ncbi:MAG: DNA gyrase subunit A [Peptococcaceae bacterium]|nr:DNA gyrase subunit A [Peptococcaceae bacterium]
MATEAFDGKIVPIEISDEMKKSFMSYSMSVIVSRALPDVRDGLKPVHRRILFTLHELGMTPNKPHSKSARLVGDCMGKYHPHGDSAIYDALVRLAQNFSSRYPLIDGHGNFGSVDGDSAAAMRYTEARMAKITPYMLADIDKNTVNFKPNYDEKLEEPIVMPARFPNLLVNGSSGIAVGMATNIPPHNLGEVVEGVKLLIDNPDADLKDLMSVIKGPDFPTGGTILGVDGIYDAYRSGRGSIRIRAKTQIEQMEKSGKNRIVVSELPYQVNKAHLVEKIAELVRDKKIEGITDLRDESDRNGMHVVIELRRDVNPQIILNQLYKHTQLQETFGVIMLALVDGQPKVLNLKEVLHYFIEHQKDVIVRRTAFDLAKAEAECHILEGLRIALDYIDEVISTIRESRTTEIARNSLIAKYGLSEKQAQAILEMRLNRLTGLEREKLEGEYQELVKLINNLKDILANEQLILDIIKKEMSDIQTKFADERRTDISLEDTKMNIEDLIEEEDVVITITHNGYIKRLPANTYKAQRRGGRGVTAMATKEEDFVEHIFTTTTHHYMLFFTNKGKVYRLKVYEIPEAGRTAKGTAIVNLLYVSGDEQVNTVIPLKEYNDNLFLFMATRRGVVKKTNLKEYNSPRKDGIIAINLDEGDELIGVKLTAGQEEIILCTKKGMAIRFEEEQVRHLGRTARGVKGITLADTDQVVAMDSVIPEVDLFTVTENGFGKRTYLNEYRSQTRGGKGIMACRLNEKTGELAGIKVVTEDEELLVITAEGIIIRININDVSRLSRASQGVTIMKTGNSKVVSLARVQGKESEEDTEEELIQDDSPGESIQDSES